MHDPRRSRRSVARDPIVHGLSKREKKKKQAKCREFVECLQSTTAPRVRLHGRIPPSYPVECDRPPKPATRAAPASRRRRLRPAAALRYLCRSFAFKRISTRCNRSRPLSQHPGRSSTRGRRRARIHPSSLLLSHRRSSAPRRPRRRHASADQPAFGFRFPFARLRPFVRHCARRVATRATWDVSIRSTGGFT